MTDTQPPADPITRAAVAGALLAIGEPQTLADHFAPAVPAPWTDQLLARQELLRAAATPEQRRALAEAMGCSYADLTHWVIRADLMRIDGLDAVAARSLAAAGVVGVRDMFAWTSTTHRFRQLRSNLSQAQPANQAPIALADLARWGRAACPLDPRVITDTTVILVVKGAGLQKADDTLGGFVNGFWPALSVLDPKATLTQRHDVFPPGYRSSPYDQQPLNLVTQIQSGERRIWIKEPYWQVAYVPDGPLAVLTSEWRMATYALGSWMHEVFAVQDTRRRRRPEVARWDPLRYLAANTLLNWSVLLHVGLTLWWAVRGGRLTFLAPQFRDSAYLPLSLLAAGSLLGLLLAIVPTIATTQRMTAYYAGQGKVALRALPGTTNWMLLLLLGAFIVSPWAYLLWLLVWITLQLALLRARAIAWPYRELVNSDSSVDDYYSVEGEIDPLTGAPPVYKRSNSRAFLRRLFVLNYRYIVVLALPITYLGLLLARVLQWTRVLRSVGEALERALTVALSSVLGDVVEYAMDSAQANRIRHVVQSDLTYFHDRPDVGSLHVFAHSQGTPITFETLFHFMPPAYRPKLKTYVTIGSVLSYYHQTNPVLDPVYIERFPVRPYPQFGEDFKWMNFWNLSDPITEFFGLDDYNLIKRAPVLKLEPNGRLDWSSYEARKARETQRDPASPTNIKTAASVLNHSEYWSNLDLVQRPFARRVLGDPCPPEWDPDKLRKLPPFLNHAGAVLLLSLIWIALFVPAALLLNVVWPLGAFSAALGGMVRGLIFGLLYQELGGLGYGFGWLVSFLAEFGSAMLTAVVYFAMIGLLNLAITFITTPFAPRPRN